MSPYKEGRKAFKKGQSEKSNPHTAYSREWNSWFDGFMFEKDRVECAQEEEYERTRRLR
jgi:hypothetical protein